MRRHGSSVNAVTCRRTHDSEVAPVQGHDLAELQTFGDSGDCGIGRAQRKIPVSLDEIGHPDIVVGGEVFYPEVARGQRPQERNLGVRPRLGREQVADLGHHRRGNHQLSAARCTPVNRSTHPR
jgi:hypothetical protein